MLKSMCKSIPKNSKKIFGSGGSETVIVVEAVHPQLLSVTVMLIVPAWRFEIVLEVPPPPQR